MSNSLSFWDQRYNQKGFVYGTKPNAWFKEQLDQLEPAKLLLPAEGEGRNATYAVKKGWEVDALDSSEKAIEKARQLALEHKIPWFNYMHADIESCDILPNYYDAIGLCYVHAPSAWRTTFHQKIVDGLKIGGYIILEAFSKDQLGKNSGGPKNIDQLFDLNELLTDFARITFSISHAVNVQLKEGDGHRGYASVVRLFGQKQADI